MAATLHHRTPPHFVIRTAIGAAIALTTLVASVAPAWAADIATGQVAAPAVSNRGDGWTRDEETGDLIYLLGGAPANGVFVQDEQTGARYWFEQGRYVTEHAFYDPTSNEWYWADADGTIARGKDVFIPVNEADRSQGGKWVRVADDYHMIKGEDCRVSPVDGRWHWWYFDPITGAMAKGATSVTSANGTKTVYYDDTMGWMLYGWHTIGSTTYYFDTVTGETVIDLPITWVGTQKYSRGRQGQDWQTLVIHTAQEKSLADIDAQFADTDGRQASAHFAVDDTSVHEYVRPEDTAWAVGNWSANTRTLSIEHVGTSTDLPSYDTLDTSAQLMAYLAHSKGWTRLTLGDNVDVHSSYSDTPCPWDIDIDWLVARANWYLQRIR